MYKGVSVQKINRQTYEKVCEFLRSKGIDPENLPNKQHSKAFISVQEDDSFNSMLDRYITRNKQQPIQINANHSHSQCSLKQEQFNQSSLPERKLDSFVYKESQFSLNQYQNNLSTQNTIYNIYSHQFKHKNKQQDNYLIKNYELNSQSNAYQIANQNYENSLKEQFRPQKYDYENKDNDYINNKREQKGRKNQWQKLKNKKGKVEQKKTNKFFIHLKQIQTTNIIPKEEMKKKQMPLVRNYRNGDAEWELRNEYDYKLYYVLKQFPNIREFKNNQKAVIRCGMQGHDMFVCMPTGGGKSLTFQTLTFLIRGVYLVVLPLISLIYDQECQAKLLGIEAYSLTGNSQAFTSKRIYTLLENFEDHQNSIVLFCTPEKLNLSPAFSAVLELLYHRKHLSRIVIDEVHCVSTWGKQFRKEYQNLSHLKQRFPQTPILALTATVTESVKQDIIEKLHIKNCFYFESSFNRPNLYYEVRDKTKDIFEEVYNFCLDKKEESGIIYCLSRKECEEVSRKLCQRGLIAGFYHADVKDKERQRVQDEWMQGHIKVITATIAFGMGINKPNVRYVIHYTLSKSIENYYQESGRAGRDGQHATCLLFYRSSDKIALQSMTLNNDYSTAKNKESCAKQLAQMIAYCENKYQCRRKLQLQYLGQYDPIDCQRKCDNCNLVRTFKAYEGILQAKSIVDLVLQLEGYRISLSRTQITALVKNKLDKKVRNRFPQLQNQNLQQMQKIFKVWTNEEIQILIGELINQQILGEKVIKSGHFKGRTISNIYIKPNIAKCKTFLNNDVSFPLKGQSKNTIHLSFKQTAINQSLPEGQNSFHQQNIQNQQFYVENAQPQVRGKLQKSNQEKEQKQRYMKLISEIFQDD